MVGKTSVSILQEYSAKNKVPQPYYVWIDQEDGFACEVEMLGIKAEGVGRSKRDAKHHAAANLIKRLRITNSEGVVDDVSMDESCTMDMIVTLRDYCVKNNHPLPVIQEIMQSGSPDAPEFVVECAIATIKRYGSADKKKEARQIAAREMLRVVTDITENKWNHTELVNNNSPIEETEEDRYLKFKTYRELTESKSSETPGVLLCDRHNFFKNFYMHLRLAGKAVLDKNYLSQKKQAEDLFRALKIDHKVTVIEPQKETEPEIIFIELVNCSYDACWAGKENEVYGSIVEYFRIML